ncbi:MAG: hypothetical protein J7L96_08255, partial [Bacteroidales bacterium]|nr:hypothetical protein [Bacteroidales bacterium]
MNIKLLKTLISRTRVSILLVFLSGAISLNAQTITLRFDHETLNNILVELRDRHGLQFSFDDQLLSEYTITANQSFDSADEAVLFLLEGLALKLEKTDGVYLIYAENPSSKPQKTREEVLMGTVKDAVNGESLPYCTISLNDMGLIADAQGRFAFSADGDSTFNIQASYLGYYILDTTLFGTGEHELNMQPSVIGIGEIVVKDKPLQLST